MVLWETTFDQDAPEGHSKRDRYVESKTTAITRLSSPAPGVQPNERRSIVLCSHGK